MTDQKCFRITAYFIVTIHLRSKYKSVLLDIELDLETKQGFPFFDFRTLTTKSNYMLFLQYMISKSYSVIQRNRNFLYNFIFVKRQHKKHCKSLV